MRRRWFELLRPVMGLILAAGCGQAVPCGDLAALSPALAEVCADGVLDCAESDSRNIYNVCPASTPLDGLDEQGVVWTRDLLFGRLPNPYHVGVDCWRGSSPELGISSYQCCYDEAALVTDGPAAGSFDFAGPFLSPQSLWDHLLLDILAWSICSDR
ncbi:MAG TPA: hypothetical protein VLM89_00180 [Phycisphaerae bacterium]|nr:hypothetical protein [Phycisphaerae bacterium]